VTSKLLNFLVPEAIMLGLNASSAADVIQNLSDRLLLAGYVRDTFAAAALAREQEIPTGLPLSGNINAAIPHTDIEHVIKPGVGMATLTEPVVFHNMISPEENVDVRLVFILALEQPKSQIEMLQEVASVLQNPELVTSLMNAHNLAEVSEALNSL